MLPQVDNRHQKEPVITSEQARHMCDRNFGIGGDGVSVLVSTLPSGLFALHLKYLLYGAFRAMAYPVPERIHK